MQRNSSFFWASDDQRANYFGDDRDDIVRVPSREDAATPPIFEDEEYHGDAVVGGDYELGEASSIPTAVAADLTNERIPLNGYPRTYESIFASSPERGRRKLFDRPSSPGAVAANNSRAAPPVVDTIRFQVVIWHIGTIDVQTGFVKMRFRLTLFWTDRKSAVSPTSGSSEDVWTMEGRQRAHRSRIVGNDGAARETIDVPPVSILNAVEFEAVDSPDITMINRATRSMRWTCMYNTTLFQGDHMSVKDFPHDTHQIKLKVGILAHRGRGGRWDHNTYRLALATEADSQGSTRIPYGLVVDHCHVPDFGFDPADLRFRFLPLTYGGWKKSDIVGQQDRDVFLQVTLPVHRQSGHYDTSILPILVMLNIIAISCLIRNFGSASASTEIMLSIAFVQVGIRLTLDSRLPCVGYQIKMQRVMNCCFWLLCGLVIESNVAFFLVKKIGWEIDSTNRIDLATTLVALAYNVYIIAIYFRSNAGSPDEEWDD